MYDIGKTSNNNKPTAILRPAKRAKMDIGLKSACPGFKIRKTPINPKITANRCFLFIPCFKKINPKTGMKREFVITSKFPSTRGMYFKEK